MNHDYQIRCSETRTIYKLQTTIQQIYLQIVKILQATSWK